jgi:sugar O-acyltransferase (sialic acid O-acetyltransferase NeuD family)
MQDLIILGTGVHAFEMAQIVERINREAPAWNLLGILSAKPDQPAQTMHGVPVLGGRELLDRHPGAMLVPCNEWPRSEAVPRERLATIVDPSVFLSPTAVLGAGCVFYPGCFIGLNARIGDRVFALTGSIVNHDDAIGNDVIFASGATLAGRVTVEDGCYLGQSCTVRQYLTIGKGSLIGMGAVVTKDVPGNSVMVGNPARKLRDRK